MDLPGPVRDHSGTFGRQGCRHRSCNPPTTNPHGRVFMIHSRAERKILHTWIILVIVKQHLAKIGRKDGPTEACKRDKDADKEAVTP